MLLHLRRKKFFIELLNLVLLILQEPCLRIDYLLFAPLMFQVIHLMIDLDQLSEFKFRGLRHHILKSSLSEPLPLHLLLLFPPLSLLFLLDESLLLLLFQHDSLNLCPGCLLHQRLLVLECVLSLFLQKFPHLDVFRSLLEH